MEFTLHYIIDPTMSTEEKTTKNNYALAALGTRIFRAFQFEQEYSITLSQEISTNPFSQYQEITIKAFVVSRETLLVSE